MPRRNFAVENKMKITGAIFDLDGTLLDSNYVWKTLGKVYLETKGMIPQDDLQEKLKATSLRDAAEIFKEDYDVSGTVEEIMDEINKAVEHHYFHIVQPKKGVPELLERFHRAGIKMCVATATDRYQVEAALERCKLLHYFGEVFTCSELGVNKHTTHIYDAASAFLGTEKDSTFVFEDAHFAMVTAKKAGLRVAGVVDSYSAGQPAKMKETGDLYFETMEGSWECFDI